MNDKRDEAISFMQRSQYDLAIPAFLELAKSDPDDYSIHYMLGQCYKFNGQLSESLESLTKSEQLIKDSTPDDMQGSIYLALGIVYQNMKEFDKAIAVFQKGIEKNTRNWNLHNSLGLTYKFINNLRESLSSYFNAQEIIVSNASHSEVRKLEDGTETLHADPHQTYINLKSSPEYCTVLNNIGGVYLAAGDLESAEKAFKESIEFIPEGFDYPPPKEGLDLIKNINKEQKK